MRLAALFKANFIVHTALLKRVELVSYSELLNDQSAFKRVMHNLIPDGSASLHL